MNSRPQAGYSGKPLIRKLGIDAGHKVRLLNPPRTYWDLLGGSPETFGVQLLRDRSTAKADVTHLFAATVAELQDGLRRARRGMLKDGAVWISWPKGSSGVPSEIGRSDVMEAGKAAGLVDVKVCAVDATWSGLKFVIPVAQR